MTVNTLKDVYIDQLQDLYSADKQALEATKKLKSAASDGHLVAALERGVEGIQDGIDTLKQLIVSHDEDPTDEFCKGMNGLVKEAESHVLNADFGDKDARDAMIITQYQRMAHYGLAGYGCAVAFATQLNLDGDAEKLQACLDGTYDGDRVMTRIATGDVNEAAVA